VKHVLKQLRTVVAELAEHELMGHAYLYGFDELPPARAENIARIAAAVREELPGLPIYTTARDPTYGVSGVLASVIDGFCPRVSAYDPGQAETARRKGREVWWYFCQGVKLPNINWYLEYPLIDVRILFGAMAARFRPDGVLYWSINSWTSGGVPRPLAGGPLFPDIAPGYKGDHGEGLLLYPGPDGPLSSLRLENVRDGLEDFECYQLLRRMTEDVAASDHAADPKVAALLAGARRLLAINPSVVLSKTQFTRDPAVLRAERRRVTDAVATLSGLANEP
jgi:hypothetical protein